MPKSTRKGGRPSREDSDRKIAQLLDYAAEAFAREGYARTSMAALATGASVSKPTIYAHFGNKSNLFTRVVAHIVKHHQIAIESVDDADAETALERQLTNILAASLDPMFLRLFRLFLAEGSNFPEVLAAFRASGEESIRLLVPHLKKLEKKTRLRAPVEAVASMLLSMSSNLVMMKCIEGGKIDVEPSAAASSIVDVVLHGVLDESPPRRK